MDAGVAGKAGPGRGEDTRWAAPAIEIDSRTTIHAAFSLLIAHVCPISAYEKGIKPRGRERLSFSFVLWKASASVTIANDLCRDAGANRHGRQVAGDYGARAHHDTIADRDARGDYYVGAQPYVIPDGDRRVLSGLRANQRFTSERVI